MPKVIVSIDGVVIKEVQLTQERTTLGRRPYNDIAIDNLAVSGEHAVLHMHMATQEVEIEDLGSTNGTYVNGKAAKRHALRNGDTIEVGKYKVRFLNDSAGENFEKTMLFKPGMVPPPMPRLPAVPQGPALIRVLSGAAAGREVALTKVVTTIGKPGVAVASITHRPHGYVLSHVEGPDMPLLNDNPTGSQPVQLKSGDRLELAGTVMQFVQG